MNVAVVTIVHGRREHLVAQQRSLSEGTRQPDDYVVVAMDDPGLATWEPPSGLRHRVVHIDGTAHGLPLAQARNTGVRRAVDGGADHVILLDADCLAGRNLVQGYVEAIAADPDVVWSGPVTYLAPPAEGGYDLDALDGMDAPHPGRPALGPGELAVGADPDLFWSLSFAAHVDTFDRVGGFCESYVGYGAEDTDFGRRAQQTGTRLGWTGSARAYHQHHPIEDPPVRHLDDILRNSAVFHRRWGTWPMTGWLEEFEHLGLVRRTPDGWVRAT